LIAIGRLRPPARAAMLDVMTRLLSAAALVLLTGCAGPQPPSLWRAERAVVWCYRTLAEPECYDEPRPAAAGRLIAAAPARIFVPLAAAGSP
jgi:hypothetical protein